MLFGELLLFLPMVEGRETAAGPGPWNSAAIGPRLNVKAPVDPPPPPPLPLTKAGDMLLFLIQSICQILPAPVVMDSVRFEKKRNKKTRTLKMAGCIILQRDDGVAAAHTTLL